MTGLTQIRSSVTASDADLYAAWLGVTPKHAEVLIALLNGPEHGRTVPRLSRATGFAFETTRAALVRLREAMDPGSITTNGLTHRLTEIGRADCAAARRDAGLE